MIQFYKTKDEHGCFSNFARYPFKIRGKTWITSEHYFQAQKFHNEEYQEQIRKAKTAMIAARLGRSRKVPIRNDWESIKDEVMHQAVLAKFTQNEEIRKILLSTGDEKIVEHTERDSYWGDGGDGSGKNMLGQILMRVRIELQGK